MAVAIPEQTWVERDPAAEDQMHAFGGWLHCLMGELGEKWRIASAQADTSTHRIADEVESGGDRASQKNVVLVASQHVSMLGKESGGMETLYSNIGTWGEWDTESARRTWASQGQTGAVWLTRRIRAETDSEALCGASAILSRYGSAGIRPIVEELAELPGPDQTETLLRALAWTGTEVDSHGLQRQIKRVCQRYLQGQRPPEVRQAAAVATRCLPEAMASRLLKSALGDTSDEETRDYIASEIQDRVG